MSAPIYGERTKVAVSKSRDEINVLLRTWGATRFQWSDDLVAPGRFMLKFVRPEEGVELAMRVTVTLPGDDALNRAYNSAARRTPRATWIAAERQQVAMQLHRILLLKLKADFNAVAAGLMSTTDALLPYLLTDDGYTVGEHARANVAQLATTAGTRLLLGMDS